mmetsp:Transcript_26420/g.66422  ORF Transcript_26420/g.66422 Transcript_26420/m.66422 type:complete len:202 (-) Transcript_26420:521-1126(-)
MPYGSPQRSFCRAKSDFICSPRSAMEFKDCRSFRKPAASHVSSLPPPSSLILASHLFGLPQILSRKADTSRVYGLRTHMKRSVAGSCILATSCSIVLYPSSAAHGTVASCTRLVRIDVSGAYGLRNMAIHLVLPSFCGIHIRMSRWLGVGKMYGHPSPVVRYLPGCSQGMDSFTPISLFMTQLLAADRAGYDSGSTPAACS